MRLLRNSLALRPWSRRPKKEEWNNETSSFVDGGRSSPFLLSEEKVSPLFRIFFCGMAEERGNGDERDTL